MDPFWSRLTYEAFLAARKQLPARRLKLSGVYFIFFSLLSTEETNLQAVKHLTEQLFSFSAALLRCISDSLGLSGSCRTADGRKIAHFSAVKSPRPAVRPLFKMIGYDQAQFSPAVWSLSWAVSWEGIPELICTLHFDKTTGGTFRFSALIWYPTDLYQVGFCFCSVCFFGHATCHFIYLNLKCLLIINGSIGNRYTTLCGWSASLSVQGL